MSTAEADKGTLQEDLTTTSPDGQRVIEVYEVEVEDADGKKSKVMNTVPREATLAEQVAHKADEILRQATMMVAQAKSGTVEVGGGDDAPTLTITLSAEPPAGAKKADKPAAAPAKAKSSTAS